MTKVATFLFAVLCVVGVVLSRIFVAAFFSLAIYWCFYAFRVVADGVRKANQARATPSTSVPTEEAHV